MFIFKVCKSVIKWKTNQEATKPCWARARTGARLPPCKHSLIVGQSSAEREQHLHLQRETKYYQSSWRWRIPFWNPWQRTREKAWFSLRNRVLYSLVKREYIKNVHLLPVILSLLFYSYGSPVETGRKQHIQMSSRGRCWELKAGPFRSVRALLNTTEGSYGPGLYWRIFPESFPFKL